MSQESEQQTPETRRTHYQAEQAFPSSTDKEDLSATLHNMDIPLKDDEGEEGEVYEGVPQEYTESYGTGVRQQPGQNI